MMILKIQKIFIFFIFCIFYFGCSHYTGQKGSLVNYRVGKKEIDAAYRPKKLGVLIGINQFEDKKWRTLRYATKDSDDLFNLLKDKSQGNFDYLKKYNSPQETNKSNIFSAIKELAKENTSPDDLVFIYLSTHGTLSKDKKNDLSQYIVVHDTLMDEIPNTGIEINELFKMFGGLISKKKVLVLAFCYSGTGKSMLSEEVNNELKKVKSDFFVKPLESVSEASIILSASAWGEIAQEDENLKNDIYTHFFIEALSRMKDKNNDGAITVTEAHDYARNQTYLYTKGKQRPTARSEILGNDPIVLAGNISDKGKPILFDYSEKYAGLDVFIDGVAKGVLPEEIVIDPGKHTIALQRKGDESPLFVRNNVGFNPGERLPVNLIFADFNKKFSLKTGYQFFLNKEVSREVIKPLMLIGAELDFNNLLSNRLIVRFDSYFTSQRQNYQIGDRRQSADLSQIAFGTGLIYPFKWGDFSLSAGPRIGIIHLEKKIIDNKNFEETSGRGENYFTLTPGLIVEMLYSFGLRSSISVATHLNYINLSTNNQNKVELYQNLFLNLSHHY